jgi:hypothetical protein
MMFDVVWKREEGRTPALRGEVREGILGDGIFSDGKALVDELRGDRSCAVNGTVVD